MYYESSLGEGEKIVYVDGGEKLPGGEILRQALQVSSKPRVCIPILYTYSDLQL